jgi:hypothetical protein
LWAGFDGVFWLLKQAQDLIDEGDALGWVSLSR